MARSNLSLLRSRSISLVMVMLLSIFTPGASAALPAPSFNPGTDSDNDGLNVTIESRYSSTNTGYTLSDADPDSDGDGLPDGWEWYWGLNPFDPSSPNGTWHDPDGDGVTNFEEYSYGCTAVAGISKMSFSCGGGTWELVDDNSSVPTNTNFWPNYPNQVNPPSHNGNGKLDNGVWWNGTAPTNGFDETYGTKSRRGGGYYVGRATDPIGDICRNNFDDDGDGLTDLNDPDWDGEVAGFAGCNDDDDDGDGLIDEDVDGYDSDGDGMHDGWEIQHGLDPTSPNGDDGAGGDPDNDGLINIFEYINPPWSIGNWSDNNGWLITQYVPGLPTNSSSERTWARYGVLNGFCRSVRTSTNDPGNWQAFGRPSELTAFNRSAPGWGCQELPAATDGINSTDPNVKDTDGDGLNDSQEVHIYFTDPTDNDTDGDGLEDGIEVAGNYGGTKITPAGQPTDPLAEDTDSDNFIDGDEDADHDGNWTQTGETDPRNPESDDDTDSDGIPDRVENNSASMTGLTGCTLNYLEPDTDFGGRNDSVESGITNDSILGWIGPSSPTGYNPCHYSKRNFTATLSSASAGSPFTATLSDTTLINPDCGENENEAKASGCTGWFDDGTRFAYWDLDGIGASSLEFNVSASGKTTMIVGNLSWCWFHTHHADNASFPQYRDLNRAIAGWGGYCDDDFRDTDGDNLTDELEENFNVQNSDDGQFYLRSDYDSRDTDGDGEWDDSEIIRGTMARNHTKYNSDPSVQGMEVILNAWCENGIDTDKDGLSDTFELSNSTDLNSDGDTLDILTDDHSTGTMRYEPGCTYGSQASLKSQGLTGPQQAYTSDYATNISAQDTDHGGVSDDQELIDGINYGFTPNPESNPFDDMLPPDDDGDGLSNSVEENITNTNPFDADTDGGGVNDGEEYLKGTNPLDPSDDYMVVGVVPIFYAKPTAGTHDSAITHYWREDTMYEYSGTAFIQVAGSLVYDDDITGTSANTTWLDSTIGASVLVTWEITEASGSGWDLQVQTNGDALNLSLPAPWNHQEVTLTAPSASGGQTLDRLDWHRDVQMSSLGSESNLMTITYIAEEDESVIPADATSYTATAGNDPSSWTTAAKFLPPASNFTVATDPRSLVDNLTTTLTAAATSDKGELDALRDFLNNADGNTNYEFTWTSDQRILAAGHSNPLDDSVYRLMIEEAGTCRDFATAMTVMARLAGIPARMVSGYRGGNWEVDQYNVTSSHRHYWSEAHLKTNGGADLGWVKYDACPAPRPVEIENLTIEDGSTNNLDWNNSGNTYFDLDWVAQMDISGQLRFSDDQEVIEGNTVEWWLIPEGNITDADYLTPFKVGQSATDVQGNFALATAQPSGVVSGEMPPERLRPGKYKLVAQWETSGAVAGDMIRFTGNNDPLIRIDATLVIISISASGLTDIPNASFPANADATTTFSASIQYNGAPGSYGPDTGEVTLRTALPIAGVANLTSPFDSGGTGSVSWDLAVLSAETNGNHSAWIIANVSGSAPIDHTSIGLLYAEYNSTEFFVDVKQGPEVTDFAIEGWVDGSKNTTALEIGQNLTIIGRVKAKGVGGSNKAGKVTVWRCDGAPVATSMVKTFPNGWFNETFFLTSTNIQEFAEFGEHGFRVQFETVGAALSESAQSDCLTRDVVGNLSLNLDSSVAVIRDHEYTEMTVTVENHLGVTTNANQVGEFWVTWSPSGSSENIASIQASTVGSDGVFDDSDGLKWQVPVELSPGQYTVTVVYNRTENFSRISDTTTLIVRGKAHVEVIGLSAATWVDEGDLLSFNGKVWDSKNWGVAQAPQSAVVNQDGWVHVSMFRGALNVSYMKIPLIPSNGTFWVDFTTPTDQAPGVYRIDVNLQINGENSPDLWLDNNSNDHLFGLIGTANQINADDLGAGLLISGANSPPPNTYRRGNGDVLQVNVTVTDDVSGEVAAFQEVVMLIDFNVSGSSTNVTVTSRTNVTGFVNLQVTIPALADPGNYTIDIGVVENLTANFNTAEVETSPANSAAKRWNGGNLTTLFVRVQVKADISIDQSGSSLWVNATESFYIAGQLKREGAGPNIDSVAMLKIYFDERPAEPFISNLNTAPDGSFNHTMTAVYASGGYMPSGQKNVIVEIVNQTDNVWTWSGTGGSHTLYVLGQTSLSAVVLYKEGVPIAIDNKTVLRGETITFEATLEQTNEGSGPSPVPVNGEPVTIHVGSHTETKNTNASGQIDFDVTIDSTVSLGALEVSFYYNGSGLPTESTTWAPPFTAAGGDADLLDGGQLKLLPPAVNPYLNNELSVMDEMKISIDDLSTPLYPSDQVTVSGNLTDLSGGAPDFGLSSSTLSLYLDGEFSSPVTQGLVATGENRFTLTFTIPADFPNGTHNVTLRANTVADYMYGNESLKNFSTRGTTQIGLNVKVWSFDHQLGEQFLTEGDDVPRGSVLNITVTLMDHTSSPVADHSVNISLIDGMVNTTVQVTLNQTGVFQFNMTLPVETQPGVFTIKAWWNGSYEGILLYEGLDGDSTSKSFDATAVTNLTLDDHLGAQLIFAGDTITISGTLSDNLSIPLQEQDGRVPHLEIRIGGVLIEVVEAGADGSFQYEYTVPATPGGSGDISVDVRYLGEAGTDNPDHYLSSSALTNYTVFFRTYLNITTDVNEVNRTESFTISGTLFDDSNTSLTGEKVMLQVKEDGLWVYLGTRIIDGNGMFSYDQPTDVLTNLGDMSIRVVYNGTSTFNNTMNYTGTYLWTSNANTSVQVFTILAIELPDKDAINQGNAVSMNETFFLTGRYYTLGSEQAVDSIDLPGGQYLLEFILNNESFFGEFDGDQFNVSITVPPGTPSGEQSITVRASQQGFYRPFPPPGCEGACRTSVFVLHQTQFINAEVVIDNVNQGDFWRLRGQLVDVDASNTPLITAAIQIKIDDALWNQCDQPLTDDLLDAFIAEPTNNLNTNDTGWFDIKIKSMLPDGSSCQTPLSKGEHTLLIDYAGLSKVYKPSSSESTTHLWAVPQFTDIDPDSSVTRSSSIEFLSLNGVLRETYSQAPVDDKDLNLTIDGLQVSLLSPIDWREGGHFRDIKAIVPSSTNLSNDFLNYGLFYPGNESAYLRPAWYNISSADDCEARSRAPIECVRLLVNVDIVPNVFDIVPGEQDLIAGTVTVTANDTGEPVEGFSVKVILANASVDEFSEFDPFNAENKLTIVDSTDSNGMMSFAFGDGYEPPLSDPGYRPMILSIQANDERLSPLSNWAASAFNGTVGDGAFGEFVDPVPVVDYTPYIMGGLLVAGLLGFIGYRYMKSRRKDAVSQMGEIFSYTAELLASGDDVREKIFECYEKLCLVLMRHRYLRRDFETVREFEVAVRKALPINREALEALDRMFEEARYSKHEMQPLDFEKSRDALELCVQGINQVGREAEAPPGA